MKTVRAIDMTHATPIDGRGRRTNELLMRLDERDRYLIEAARFYPGLSHREVARQVRIAVLRYKTGRWRRTGSELRCPHDGERLDALLWCLLRVRDRVPSERLIRSVLADSTIPCPPDNG